MLPEDRLARARCRAISGEMHAGFAALRSTLPMNLRGHVPNFTLWSGARADIERILWIWRDCLGRWGGPWLLGAEKSVADAMYAPVVTRFRTYDVKLDAACEAYACRRSSPGPTSPSGSRRASASRKRISPSSISKPSSGSGPAPHRGG